MEELIKTALYYSYLPVTFGLLIFISYLVAKSPFRQEEDYGFLLLGFFMAFIWPALLGLLLLFAYVKAVWIALTHPIVALLCTPFVLMDEGGKSKLYLYLRILSTISAFDYYKWLIFCAEKRKYSTYNNEKFLGHEYVWVHKGPRQEVIMIKTHDETYPLDRRYTNWGSW